MEHLALCAHFVDRENNIREEFLAFIALERITGEEIAETILKFLKDNVENMHGVMMVSATCLLTG